MRYDDMFLLSLGVNVGLLIRMLQQDGSIKELRHVLHVTMMCIRDAADQKIKFVRTEDGVTVERVNGNQASN